MSDPARRLDPESLLEHRAFVRAVVRKLIPDEHGVEDIVQETCLKALRSPPSAPGALRAWLARVGRNLAVSSLRWVLGYSPSWALALRRSGAEVPWEMFRRPPEDRFQRAS